MYIERSQIVQYFTHSFTTCQVLNVIASYEYQKNECIQQWNLFKCQISTFYFSTLLSKFIWTLIDTRRSDRMRDATAAIAGLVIETTHQPGLFSSTFSCPQANFLHPTCIAGLVKHLSPYTGRISEWMVFEQRLFAQRKWIIVTERCYRMISAVASTHLSLTNDVTVTSS